MGEAAAWSADAWIRHWYSAMSLAGISILCVSALTLMVGCRKDSCPITTPNY